MTSLKFVEERLEQKRAFEKIVSENTQLAQEVVVAVKEREAANSRVSVYMPKLCRGTHVRLSR